MYSRKVELNKCSLGEEDIMSLKEYNRKRNFQHTPEPSGKKFLKTSKQLIFVVQLIMYILISLII